jgi:hypothetical protein
MATTFQWSILDMYVVSKPQPNFVTIVRYSIQGTDENNNTATIERSETFSSDSDNLNFIPYEDLTEEIVLGWIQKDPDTKINIEQTVQGQIDAMLAPPDLPARSTPPWL